MSTQQLWLGGAALAALLIALGGFLTRPAALAPPIEPANLGSNPVAHIAERESKAQARYGIVDGAEKRIRWHGEPGERTQYAVIYLHGFSATRQEIAPVPERVAQALGANLFETRLHGHGRVREPLVKVSAESWLEDGAEALAIGRALGERLIVIGTSTGATLALAMADHPGFAAVDSLVFVSPNWGPAAAGSEWSIGPYGPQLVRLIAGEEYAWAASNELHDRFWSTSYPTDAIVEMMRLVKLADALTERSSVPSAMLLYSPKDDVVSVPKLLAGFERLPAERKAVIAVDEPRSLSKHVIAGDILAPAETEATVEKVVEFLKAS